MRSQELSYLVLGLPRSRTAWLSLLLTHGESFCFHDLSGLVHHKWELAAKIQSHEAYACGAADSGAILALGEVMAAMPHTRLVYVERPVREVAASMHELLRLRDVDLVQTANYITRLAGIIDDAQHRYPGLKVRYEDLDSEVTCRAIWQHVTQDRLPFPVEHFERMKRMKVTVRDEIMQEPGLDNEFSRHAISLLA